MSVCLHVCLCVCLRATVMAAFRTWSPNSSRSWGAIWRTPSSRSWPPQLFTSRMSCVTLWKWATPTSRLFSPSPPILNLFLYIRRVGSHRGTQVGAGGETGGGSVGPHDPHDPVSGPRTAPCHESEARGPQRGHEDLFLPTFWYANHCTRLTV